MSSFSSSAPVSASSESGGKEPTIIFKLLPPLVDGYCPHECVGTQALGRIFEVQTKDAGIQTVFECSVCNQLSRLATLSIIVERAP